MGPGGAGVNGPFIPILGLSRVARKMVLFSLGLANAVMSLWRFVNVLQRIYHLIALSLYYTINLFLTRSLGIEGTYLPSPLWQFQQPKLLHLRGKFTTVESLRANLVCAEGKRGDEGFCLEGGEL